MKFFTLATVTATLLGLAAPAAFADPAVCPNAAEQLPELLASAMQRQGREGDMMAEFEVDAKGSVRQISVQGYRQYRTPVRLALESLECHGGTPQRYVLRIRFAEPVKPSELAASAPMIAISVAR
ncbi:MAG: hypothetical protein JO006_02270 [Paucibacter sp.]|nr:hypothetical protein [Roseateles sp.]